MCTIILSSTINNFGKDAKSATQSSEEPWPVAGLCVWRRLSRTLCSRARVSSLSTAVILLLSRRCHVHLHRTTIRGAIRNRGTAPVPKATNTGQTRRNVATSTRHTPQQSLSRGILGKPSRLQTRRRRAGVSEGVSESSASPQPLRRTGDHTCCSWPVLEAQLTCPCHAYPQQPQRLGAGKDWQPCLQAEVPALGYPGHAPERSKLRFGK